MSLFKKVFDMFTDTTSKKLPLKNIPKRPYNNLISQLTPGEKYFCRDSHEKFLVF
tara:strand:+ start:1864 stop:2028 length:165 start_codon:yes stop_codon:yes gene_type:complete